MARFVALLAILALAACKPPAPTLDPFAQPIAHGFFDEVSTGGDLMDDTHLAHELKNPTTVEQIADFRTLIPSEQPRSIVLDHWDVQVNGTGETTRLKETYTFSDRALIVQTALFKSPGGTQPVIVGFEVAPDTAGAATGS